MSANRQELKQTFTCESSSIAVDTIYSLPSEPLRVDTQTVTFQYVGGTKIVKYNYSEKQKSYSIIIDAGFCSSTGQNAIVLLLSSVLSSGGCSDCDWIDFYTIKGVYLGSDKIPKTFENEKFKHFLFSDSDKTGNISIFDCDPTYCHCETSHCIEVINNLVLK